jgi:DNA-3-methyladenine glycosylase II
VIDFQVDVRPRWPFRLPRRLGFDGVLRRRGSSIVRLLHVGGEPVVVAASQPARERVLFSAQAENRDAAEHAVGRMRFALGVDDDLRDFHERFRWDPLLGRMLRADPWFRVERRPQPFEALVGAICQQLIESERAYAIQRRIVWRLGRRCERTDLRDLPSAETLAAVAPVRLQALDLSAGRSLALRRAAREIATGRVDLEQPDRERGWRRLQAIGGIGRWTIEMLALHGQGCDDAVPAGDLNLLKLVGRLRGGDPRAIAEEDEVREFFDRYAPYRGLAAMRLLTGAPRRRLTVPDPGGTRSSALPPRLAPA